MTSIVIENDSHRNALLQMVAPLPPRSDCCAMHTSPELDSIRQCLQSTLACSVDFFGIHDVSLEVERVLLVVGFDFGFTGRYVEDIKNLV